MSKSERKILVLPDIHAPYQDAKALALIARVARKERFTHVVSIGDLADCHSVSAHQKTAERRLFWQEEIDCAAEVVSQIRTWGDEFKMCEGNHETRLSRYIMDKAPELEGSHAKIQDLLGVKKSEWHPYRTHFWIGNVAFTHDCGHSGPGSLKQTLDAFGANVVFGHTHRLGIHYDGEVEGSHRFAMNVGWLGDEKFVNYMFKVKLRAWQKGFGVVTQKSGLSWAVAVPIVKNSCVVNGNYYKV